MYEETVFVPAAGDRQLCVFQAGNPDGIPVLVQTGTPGSRLLDRERIKTAVEFDMRLIGYDRPGYGQSTAHPGRRVSDAATDVASIVEFLGIENLCVWGASGGGPHALACAALLPEVIVAAACFASLAPLHSDSTEWFAGMPEDNVADFTAALKGNAVLEELLQPAAQEILSSDVQSFSAAMRTVLHGADADAFTDDFASHFLDSVRLGITNSIEGWVEDDIAFVSSWGFDLEEIKIPVLLVHGESDNVVPISHGRWLANHIPNAETRFPPEDGHMSIVPNWISHVNQWFVDALAT